MSLIKFVFAPDYAEDIFFFVHLSGKLWLYHLMDRLTPILGFDFLKSILRALGIYGSGRMDDDGVE